MKKSHIMRTVCAVGVSAACAWGLAGCTTTGEASDTTDVNSGAVAATVDGVDIYENAVSEYIAGLRSQYSLTDEAAWGQYLAQQDSTPAAIRENVIDSFVTRELIRSHAGERDITVESSEVDSQVDQMKKNYESDEKWQEALTKAGMTDQEYREEIELQLLNKHLYESFAVTEEPSEEDQLQYAQMYASAYDGAKRSSHVLFAAEDEATAQEVLDKLNAGEMDIADAAKEYSKDTGSAEKGGDVGWDKTSSLVEEYQTALDGLEKDQLSGLVTSTYGIHIIKCTDVYNAPKEKAEDGTETVKVTSVDQIPSEWLDSLKESLNSQKQSEAYQAWMDEKKEAADIKINDMPSGLPYDLDMSKYQSATDSGAEEGNPESDGSGDAAQGDGAEGAAEGEAPADDGAAAEGSTDGAAAGEGQPAAEGGDAPADANAAAGEGSGQVAEAA